VLGEDALLRRAVCALARADEPLFFAVLHVRQIPKETPNREHQPPSKRRSSFTNSVVAPHLLSWKGGTVGGGVWVVGGTYASVHIRVSDRMPASKDAPGGVQ